MIFDRIRSIFNGLVLYYKGLALGWALRLWSILNTVTCIPVRDGDMPPGPICNWLPVFGSLPLLLVQPYYKVLTKMAKWYGRIFRLTLGETNFVVISDHELLQQVFLKSEVTGRYLPSPLSVMDHKGIIHADGNFWRTQRNFAITALRRLGIPNKSNGLFEERATSAIDDLLLELERTNGQPIYMDEPICFTINNIFFALIVGKIFSRDDHRLMAIINDTHESLRSLSPISLSNYIKHFSILPKEKKLNRDIGFKRTEFVQYMRRIVRDHVEVQEPRNPPDLIDAYLARMRKDRDDNSTTFTEDQLYYVLGDLFSAGLVTTSATLHWLLLAIVTKPLIQENIHNELDEVIFTRRQPNLSDRSSLPYLTATILEGLRFPSVLPIGVLHSTNCHTTIEGHDIPVDSIVVGLFWKFHRDPKLWSNPNSFDPGNHLDANGCLERSRFLMPFSHGRRVCLGHHVAENEIFLIFANLLNKFKFLPEEGVPLPSMDDCMEGVLRAPLPFRIRAIPRDANLPKPSYPKVQDGFFH